MTLTQQRSFAAARRLTIAMLGYASLAGSGAWATSFRIINDSSELPPSVAEKIDALALIFAEADGNVIFVLAGAVFSRLGSIDRSAQGLSDGGRVEFEQSGPVAVDPELQFGTGFFQVLLKIDEAGDGSDFTDQGIGKFTEDGEVFAGDFNGNGRIRGRPFFFSIHLDLGSG